jgi:transcription elongation factor Elf1
MSEWSISVKCHRCNRSSSTIKSIKDGETRVIGCKECDLSTTLTITAEVKLATSDMEIQIYRFYGYDS